MAGGSSRRARASADAAAAGGPAYRRASPPDPLARATLRGGGGCLPHRGRRRHGGLRAESVFGALAVHRPGAAATDHGRRGEDLRAATGSAGPPLAISTDRKTPREPPTGASSAPRCDTAACGPPRTVRPVGLGGRAVPGGPLAHAALRLGPGPEGAGPVGHLSPGGPLGRSGAGRPLRGVFRQIGGTDPGRAGSAEDLLGPHGGRQTIPPRGIARRRPHAAPPRGRIPTLAV